jgi:hypothetical protein
MIRILALALAMGLSACVNDFDACSGNPACMAERQDRRDMMMSYGAQWRPQNTAPLFYAMPPIASGNGAMRLQTNCTSIGIYTYCN